MLLIHGPRQEQERSRKEQWLARSGADVVLQTNLPGIINSHIRPCPGWERGHRLAPEQPSERDTRRKHEGEESGMLGGTRGT